MPYTLPSRLMAAAVFASAALAGTGAAFAQNLAVVNGKAVPLERVEILKQQIQERNGGRELPPELTQQLKDEVITREIFMQEAQRRGLEKNASFRQNMEMARQTILIRELFVDFEKASPVTPAEIKAEYDKIASTQTGKEYRASHILLESEQEAKDVIAQLKKGKKFTELAEKHSKDPGSAAEGGDLGWADPSSYVSEFSEAMVALEKGATSAPVQSDFGWHIIKLEDVRDAQVPSLEELQGEIQERLEQEKMLAFQQELRAKAKIE